MSSFSSFKLLFTFWLVVITVHVGSCFALPTEGTQAGFAKAKNVPSINSSVLTYPIERFSDGSAGMETLSTTDSLTTEDIQYDDQNMQARTYSGDLSERYNGESFDYSEKNFSERKLVTGILSDVLSAIAKFLGFDLPPWVAEIVKYLFYAALISGAIYFLLKTFRSGRSESILAKTASKIKASVSAAEAPQQIDYQKTIKDLEAEKDYRTAVRYYYLWMLRTLEDKGAIEWHREKTNAEYLQEISDDSDRDAFQQASFIYDHIWYGEFPVDQSLYERARERFSNLLNPMAA